MKKMFILNLLLMLFLTGCISDNIKGEDIEKDFERSDYYSVTYGTETHFETGGLISSGSYFSCDGKLYYSDHFGKYIFEDGVVSTYLLLNGKMLRVEVDNPRVENIPNYDLDLFEEKIWERTFKSRLLFQGYNQRDDEYNITIYDYSPETLSYQFIEMGGTDIFQFYNGIDPNYCIYPDTTIPLSTMEDLILELLEYAPYNPKAKVYNISYDEQKNEVKLDVDGGYVYLKLSQSEVFYDFEGVNDFSHNIQTNMYSWYNFVSNQYEYSLYLPDALNDQFDDINGNEFLQVLVTYNSIFIT